MCMALYCVWHYTWWVWAASEAQAATCSIFGTHSFLVVAIGCTRAAQYCQLTQEIRSPGTRNSPTAPCFSCGSKALLSAALHCKYFSTYRQWPTADVAHVLCALAKLQYIMLCTTLLVIAPRIVHCLRHNCPVWPHCCRDAVSLMGQSAWQEEHGSTASSFNHSSSGSSHLGPLSPPPPLAGAAAPGGGARQPPWQQLLLQQQHL